MIWRNTTLGYRFAVIVNAGIAINLIVKFPLPLILIRAVISNHDTTAFVVIFMVCGLAAIVGGAIAVIVIPLLIMLKRRMPVAAIMGIPIIAMELYILISAVIEIIKHDTDYISHQPGVIQAPVLVLITVPVIIIYGREFLLNRQYQAETRTLSLK